MRNLLRKIGLSEKEILIYLSLLEYGTRPASFVAQKTGLNRGTTYNILQSLIEKNIIYQTVRAEIRQFTAHDPEKLLSYLDKESQRLQDLKSDVGGIIPDLQALQQNLHNSKPRFKYFEGRAALRDLLDQTVLHNIDREIFSLISMKDFDELLGPDYTNKNADQRIANGVMMNVIRSDHKEHIKDRWQDSRKDKRNLRYLPDHITPPDMTMYLWNRKNVALFASKKESYGLLIESPDFYQTQKALWDGFWAMSITK